ncbi:MULTISPECIES: hypothetical protein [Bacteroides]|uniref:Phage tail tape measure protein n=1 Tax=Bacteroides ovatus TaxID=28116 RepID=A0A413EFL8_BACOV|nr:MULTISPECIES: hypothetical protein [Bacteroides]RGE74361.1 hypothetical protein DWZ47_27720 [Bacteroides sp. AF32-8BH]RGX05660.1 hypothetical protein DWV35_24650 [Bacteroides ovatus]RGX16751.1 hypothetical protein DWV30_24370 [Bacteroides ovatus]
MAGLKFTLEADVKKLQELRKEIEKVTVAISKLPSDSPQIRKLETQLSQLRKEYDGIETLLSKVQLMGEELAKSENLIKHTRKQTDETKKATEHFEAEAGSLAALEKQAKSLTKEWLAMSEARKQSDVGQGKVNELAKVNAQIKIEKDNLRALQKEYVNTQKIQDLQEGSIKSLRAELSNLNAVYDSLGRSQRKGAYGKELLNGIQTVYKELVEAEQASGRFQRNVGNYASAWNGLGNSVQQVARELPSLAVSANTFFLAISNNLPILVDEIAKARKEYANFKAELKAGNKDVKAVAPVWQQLTRSILSWQTALVVGLTLLSVYGKDVIKWIGSLGKARDVTLDLLSAEQEMALARKSAWSSIAKEQTQLDILYNKLKNVTLSTTERNAAVREWVKNYKTHSDILDGENVDLRKLENAYRALSKEIYANAVARAYADRIAELSVQREKEEMKRLNQKLTIAKAEQELERVTAEYNKKANEGFGTATAKLEAKDKIIQARKNVEDQKKIYNDLVNNVNDYDKNITVISNHIKTLDLFPQPKEGTYDYWKQQVEIADNALKQIQYSYLKVLKSGSTQGVPEEVAKQYNALIKQKTEAEEKLKIYDDKRLSKEYNSILDQQKKIANLLDKQALERKRREEDLENQVIQVRIDAMAEGEAKIRAQRELNNKLEIQNLKRRREDYVRTEIEYQKKIFTERERLNSIYTKKYKKKTFDPSSVKVDTSLFDNAIEIISKRQLNDQIRSQEEAWNEYIIKYGTFQQKKEAITRKYTDAINKAANAGEAASLQKEFEEALANLDLSKLKDEINWEMIFGSISKATKEQLTKIKKQLQEFKKSPEFKNATPEQIQVIETAINSINDALVDKGGFFGGLSNSLTEYEDAVNKVKEAQEELNKALESGDEVAIEKAQKKKNAAENTLANAQTNVEKSRDKAISNITAVADAMKQLGSAEFNLSSFGSAVGGLVDALSESGSKIGGIIAAILSLLDEFGKDGGIEFGKNLVNNVISAIGGTIEVPFKMLGIDLGLGGANYSDYNEMVAKYDVLLDVWDQLLDKKKAYINESYGAEATKAGKEALDLLKAERDITRELASSRLDAGASAGSHSMAYRMWQGSYKYEGQNWKDVAGEISSALGGVEFSSMWNLLYMSADQLEWIKTNYSGLWSQMDTDFRGYLDDIIQYGETEAEIIESVKEQITGISFDSFRDSYVSLLSDLDSTNKDFADSFEEYLRKSILQSVIAKNYDTKIQELYDSWSKAGEDGVFSESEVDRLRSMQQSITDAMLAERDRLEEVFGWSSSSSQEASKKGFATASQDSIDELNGRFTALQIAGEEIKSQSVEQTRLLDSINSILLNIDPSQASFKIPDLSNREALNSIFAADIAMRAESNAQLQAAIVNLTGEVQTIKNNVSEMLTFSAEDRINQQTIADNSSSLNKNLPKITQVLDGIKQNTNGLSRR